MVKIRMRKNNVLIRQVRKKEVGQDVHLHLPDGMKMSKDKQALFDLVVEGIGPDVNIPTPDRPLRIGDRVVILHLDPARHFIPDPNGDGVLAVIQDDMIQGVMEGE